MYVAILPVVGRELNSSTFVIDYCIKSRRGNQKQHSRDGTAL